MEEEKVYWRGWGQNGFTPGWAGDGECTILDVTTKDGFGPEGIAGPAARIQMKARGNCIVWVPVNELEGV